MEGYKSDRSDYFSSAESKDEIEVQDYSKLAKIKRFDTKFNVDDFSSESSDEEL